MEKGGAGDKTFHFYSDTKGNKGEPPRSLGEQRTYSQKPSSKTQACLRTHLAHGAFQPKVCLATKLAPSLPGSSRQVGSPALLRTPSHPTLFPTQLFRVGLQYISPERHGPNLDPSETRSEGLGKGDKPSIEGHTRGTWREATPSFLGPLNLVINRTARSSDTVPSSFPQIRTSEAQKSSERCPRSRVKSGPWILVPAHHPALHPGHCGPSLTIIPQSPCPATFSKPEGKLPRTTRTHKDLSFQGAHSP